MPISDKLNYLIDTKEQIRQAIQEKGVPVDQEEPFRDYAAMIGQISGGGGGGGGTDLPRWINSTWSEYVTAGSATAPGFPDGQAVPGDLLLLTVMARSDIVSVPTGFVEKARSPVTGVYGQYAALFTKIADGTEAEFQVTLASSGRTCVNVSLFRSSNGSPEVLIGSSAFIEQGTNFKITWDGVSNPSTAVGGMLVVVVTCEIASTSGSGTINLPFYGFSSIHNMIGTSQVHQNRMMICSKIVEAGEVNSLFSPLTAMETSPSFSSLTFLVY